MVLKDLEDPRRLSMLRSQIDANSVEDIMDSDFPTVDPEDRLSDVLLVMKDSNYQEVPVMDNGTYMGVVSYSSVLKKRNVNMETKAKNLIKGVPILSLTDKITAIAEAITGNNCRQLPVMSGKKVIGVVSRNALVDIASKIKALGEIKVWELMTSPSRRVGIDEMLTDAYDIMTELDTLTIPVVDHNDNVVGVVGMKEIIDNNWKDDTKTIGDMKKRLKADVTLRSLYVSSPIVINWDATVKDAAELMVKNDISTLPVVEGHKLVGIMTQYDIIEVISACRERELMFTQISGLHDDDKNLREALFDIIEEQISKISKVYTPESLMIHVTRYNDDGGLAKYSMTARLYLKGNVMSYKEVGWDLMQTTLNLMKKVTESVMNLKDTKVKFRQRPK
ncbi:MAG TPA: CBS domain-containing protein [Candidatus Methanomethylophilaceae archaeon]|nr:CBS domain-containing protein [Candidatus Methanomethylophilaceae archaeon]